jgi:DNA-binding response OmpR family regulator
MSGEAQRPLVLVADDEPAITALVAEILGFAGLRVARAHAAREAISAARAERPDLILLDVMMPDLDGRDVCRVLKMDQALRGVPVVLFSSADERDVHWRDAGADGFLQKPFSVRSLPGFVRGHLGAHAGQQQA